MSSVTAKSQPILVSIEDTQKILSLGRSSIYELLAEGSLRSVKLGKRKLVLQSSIEELVERLCAQEQSLEQA
jgi:excisionase family DNA binding protein